MFHLAAFFESIDNTANVDIQPVVDDILAISNNHFLPQNDLDIIFGASCASNLLRTRIVSPTNRQITLPFLRPIVDGTAFPANPDLPDYSDFPFRIRGLEELAVESTASAAGPQDNFVLLGLQQTYEPVPRGNIFTMRGTSVTASADSVWTSLAVTWADTLPEGSYMCVGGEVIGVTEIAFRFIFENQVWRPGGPATVLESSGGWRKLRKGALGVWGRFKPTRMPIVQILNSAAAVAVHTVYLDLIRVA